MPWLSIIMALLTFFASGGAKKENRGKAALAALGVGAATYGVTHYTDWGKENLGFLDGVETTGTGISTALTTANGTAATTPATAAPGTTAPSTTTAGNSGLWNSLSGWLTSPAGQLTTGAAAGTALGMPKWLLWGGMAVGAYLILK